MRRLRFLLALLCVCSFDAAAEFYIAHHNSGDNFELKSRDGSRVVQLSPLADRPVFLASLGGWVKDKTRLGLLRFLSYGRIVEVQIDPDYPLTYPRTFESGHYYVDLSFSTSGYSVDGFAASYDEAFSQAFAKRSGLECQKSTLSTPVGDVDQSIYDNPDLNYVDLLFRCRSDSSISWVTIPVEVVRYSRVASQREARDNVLRVLRLDGKFKKDASDPDWTSPLTVVGASLYGANYIASIDSNGHPIEMFDGIFTSSSYFEYTTWHAVANPVTSPSGSIAHNMPMYVQVSEYGEGIKVRTFSTDGIIGLFRTITTDPVDVYITRLEQFEGGSPRITDYQKLFSNIEGYKRTQPYNFFPGDYAKRGEWIAGGTRLKATGAAAGDPEVVKIEDDEEFNAAFFGEVLDDLKFWQLPAHASQCPKPSYTLWDVEHEMTAHCDLFDIYGASISLLFDLVWTLAALYVVLKG